MEQAGGDFTAEAAEVGEAVASSLGVQLLGVIARQRLGVRRARRRRFPLRADSQVPSPQLTLGLEGGWCSADPGTLAVRRRHRRGIARCESALERQMAFAFAQLAGFRWRKPADHQWELGRWDHLQLVLLAQPSWGRFRTDFAMLPVGWSTASPLPIVVEVDSHHFHERTQAQAEHDRSRDRLMAYGGTSVLRFTGSQIRQGAVSCASEVLDYAARVLTSATFPIS